MKQTGTEYLIEQVKSKEWQDMWIWHKEEVFEKAKEMEKEQIIDAFGIGCQVESTRLIGYQGMAEQYYNETYNKDK